MSGVVRVGLDISALDPRFKSHAQRGIGRYVSELKRNIEVDPAPGVEVGFFNHETLVEGGVASMVRYLPLGRTTFKQQFVYPLRLGQGEMRRFSFLHFPAHMDAPAWTTKPFVLTVLDLIPLVLSDLYRANKPSWRFTFARWLELQAIRRAALILAISENTAKDVERLLGIPRDRIAVTPLGVDESFFGVAARRRERVPEQGDELRKRLAVPLGRPILLYVGGHDERKNVEMLLAMTRKVLDTYRAHHTSEPPPVLVMAGRISEGLERERLERARERFDLSSDLVELGYVSDDDLKALYAETAVFVFPSLYEGFGLPVLEAMAAGVPVVSSNTSSMPEVVGDAGLLFDPRNCDEGAEKVISLLTEPALASSMAERGVARARLFTWRETCRKTLEAYQLVPALIGKRSRGAVPVAGAEVPGTISRIESR